MEQKKQNRIEPINIENIFKQKNPQLAKWIPKFIIRYIKRITHEKTINEIIRDFGHLQGFEFSKVMIKYFNISIHVKGEENLPKDGRFVFVSNHPLGGFDGHILMYLIGKKYGRYNYKFLVNDILMGLKNLHDVFVPVNKHGRQDANLAKQIDDIYSSDIQVLTFPAGLVSRKIDGKITDLDWQKNFITKSKKHHRNVIPIHVTGRNTNFFYRLGSIRKFLRIKANIEMFYLIDETFKHKNKSFDITFGKPISWETFNSSKKPIEWARWVKNIVYKMAE